jgi:hypothetical protein
VILGHVECRQGQKVLDLYLEQLYIREKYPDPVTFMGRKMLEGDEQGVKPCYDISSSTNLPTFRA